MEFEEALKKLKDGFLITNRNLKEKGIFLHAVSLCKNSAKNSPFICLVDVDANWVPWTPSQQDLFSNKWEVVKT